MKKSWFDNLNASITICDLKGIIVYMNKKAAEGFSSYGGFDLLGKNLFDCHSDSSNEILSDMIENKKENIYTIEKSGVKTLICQKPLYKKGEIAGLIEITIDLPAEMPHRKRD